MNLGSIQNPTVDEPCDVCGAAGTFVTDVRVSVAGRFAADIRACTACGFRQIRPRPAPAVLADCYDDTYFLTDAPGNLREYVRQRHRHHRQAYFLARDLRAWRPRGRLLEIGCALGFLLEGLQRHLDWRLEGLDISPFAAHFAARELGLDVRAATLPAAAYPDETFDFVVQKDLVEHVSRPREHLLETRRVLKRGGRTWLVVPNSEAHLRPLRQRAAERPADEPDLLPLLTQPHVSFFNRANLLRLFADCGFRVLRLRSVGIKRGWRLLGWLPAKRRPPLVAAAPAAAPSTPAVAAASDGIGEAVLRDHARRLAARLAEVAPDRPPRRLYDRWRRLMTELDTLPARLPWGVDFECLLERRD